MTGSMQGFRDRNRQTRCGGLIDKIPNDREMSPDFLDENPLQHRIHDRLGTGRISPRRVSDVNDLCGRHVQLSSALGQSLGTGNHLLDAAGRRNTGLKLLYQAGLHVRGLNDEFENARVRF